MRERLTRREQQCVELAGQRLSAKAIRLRLGIGSERTVESHLASAYSKLGVHDREAAWRALRTAYGEIPIPMGGEIEAPPSEGADAAGHPGPDGDQGRRSGWYELYLGLGRWREPPRPRGGRTVLIFAAAALIVIGLGGAMALLKVVFEVVESGRDWLG